MGNINSFNAGALAECTAGTWQNIDNAGFTVSGIITDTRKDCSDAIFIPLSGENFDGHDFLDKAIAAGAKALCIEEAKVSLAENYSEIPVLMVKNTMDAYQKIARFCRRRLPNIKIIGVTGSSGKTSTKEIIKAVCSQAYGADHVYATEANNNNHIGVPLTLLNLNENHQVGIIEMGSNHPGEIEILTRIAEPDIAVISIIGSCHLEFLGDLNGVAREKTSIFKGLPENGIAVIPADSPGQDILRNSTTHFQVISFGKNQKDDISYNYLGGNLKGSSFELIWQNNNHIEKIEWHLAGIHQASNAAAAAACATALGLNPHIIAEGITGTSLPGMRMKIQEINGVTWINDAYNANPDSMRAGLNWLAEFANSAETILILGDMLELGEASGQAHFQVLQSARQKFPESEILAIGPQMTLAAEKLNNPQMTIFNNSDEASKTVSEHLNKGKMVFLKGSRGMKLEKILPYL